MESTLPNDEYDLLIVGGGIGGVIGVHYAKKAGLKVLLLEKQGVVGGLWAQLPAWQDIQINQNDWTLGDLPITGTDQASIATNIQAWVDKFDLAPLMRLNTPVTNAQATASGWKVTTPEGVYFSRFLLAATGVHNRPVIPQVQRQHSAVEEFHSSALHDPGRLTGKDVVVVGGGASAYDLLDLCFQYKTRSVIWVYRSLKWMVPTRKPKHLAGDLRGLSRQQMLGVLVDQMNIEINQDLLGRYEKFGLNALLPDGRFDFGRHQMIPGRCGMIANFARIELHRGELSRLCGRTVHLSSGARFDADLILWGTGYEVDLTYFDSPVLAQTTRTEALAARCGSLFRSLDAPNLFFLAPSLLESTSTSPWAYAHACRTIVSHICGKAVLDTQPVLQKLNYFELAKFLATRDPENYPPDTWFASYRGLAMNHPDGEPMPVP
jgi:cation diffusion facilitator CzcD-associated flavoprotein CzcO